MWDGIEWRVPEYCDHELRVRGFAGDFFGDQRWGVSGGCRNREHHDAGNVGCSAISEAECAESRAEGDDASGDVASRDDFECGVA